MTYNSGADFSSQQPTTQNEWSRIEGRQSVSSILNLDEDNEITEMWEIIPDNSNNEDTETNDESDDGNPLLENDTDDSAVNNNNANNRNNNNRDSAFYDRAVIYLSSLIDASAFLLVSFVILKIFVFAFNISTFSDDTSKDIRNYINIPANILYKNNITLLYNGETEGRMKSDNPYSISRLAECFFDSWQLKGYSEYSFYEPFNLTCLLTYNSTDGQNAVVRDNSTLKIIQEATESAKHNFRLISVIRTTNISGQSTGDSIQDIIQNQQGYVVFNSLLFKISNAVIDCVPWYSRIVPTAVLRATVLLIYFVYGCISSFYLFSCFVFFSISMYYLVSKKFLDISSHIVNLLNKELPGIF